MTDLASSNFPALESYLIRSKAEMTDFHSLYQSYAPLVHRFALFLCGDSALADDITSETFVRAWTARGKIREATVKAYLFTIARNLYRDYLRREKKNTELEESMPDSSPGLAARTEHKAELSAVMEALSHLPEADRAALLMRAQEEMPYEEIAQVLNLPLTTVKVKVHRARLKLMQVRRPFHEEQP